uniref:Uncharacterized protein n=1 Tax=Anguilla anguilla TaxID=7936 RepID=A0A0E9QTV3_ANGAN
MHCNWSADCLQLNSKLVNGNILSSNSMETIFSLVIYYFEKF